MCGGYSIDPAKRAVTFSCQRCCSMQSGPTDNDSESSPLRGRMRYCVWLPGHSSSEVESERQTADESLEYYKSGNLASNCFHIGRYLYFGDKRSGMRG